MGGATMKLEIITFWYNEEFLAPFFLKHYEPVDKITVIVDADTTDRTIDILSSKSNIEIHGYKFTDGMDTEGKQDALNSIYNTATADWVLMVDADEFIDFNYFKYLLDTKASVFYVMLYQVYRNRMDKDLDLDLPVIGQRIHGDPNISNGLNALYKKPIVVRSGKRLRWCPGCHRVIGAHKDVVFDNRMLVGAHWAMADPCFCIERRLSRRERISAINKARGMSWHNYDVTHESLLRECTKHLDDPEVLV
jgi:glycosyltransferase involved in cell wall biosynthesis